jgi:hypothetical protein
MLDDDLILIWEQYSLTTLYHGSYGNTTFDNPTEKGIWFVEDIDAGILDYYSSRGGQSTILKCMVDLGNVLDLTMYNADEYLLEDDAEEFLIDVVESRSQKWIDYFFYEDFETDFDEYGEPRLATSVILNHIIEYEPIIKSKYDSLAIMESDDETTYNVFDKASIKRCDKV